MANAPPGTLAVALIFIQQLLHVFLAIAARLFFDEWFLHNGCVLPRDGIRPCRVNILGKRRGLVGSTAYFSAETVFIGLEGFIPEVAFVVRARKRLVSGTACLGRLREFTG